MVPVANLREDTLFLEEPLRWNDEGDGLPDRLGRRVSEHTLCRSIPRRDDAVEILADDDVLTRFDDRGKLTGRERGAPEMFVQPRDQHADRDEEPERQILAGIREGNRPARSDEPDRGGQGRHRGRECARTEAAVPARREHGGEKQQVRRRLAEKGMERESRQHRGNDRERGNRVPASERSEMRHKKRRERLRFDNSLLPLLLNT